MNLKNENERRRCRAQIVDENPYLRSLGVSIVLILYIYIYIKHIVVVSRRSLLLLSPFVACCSIFYLISSMNKMWRLTLQLIVPIIFNFII